jgi:lipoprotein-anchoring transpeptidase ErfK/SrfK
MDDLFLYLIVEGQYTQKGVSMFRTIRKFCLVSVLALLLVIVLAASPPFSPTSYASSSSAASRLSSSIAYATSTGVTTGWSNVRTGTNTSAQIDHVLAPNTTVTIYDTVSGQIAWGDISTWYRVSPLNSSPLYIYGGLIAVTSGNINRTNNSAPSGQGKIIVVSISQEELDAYDNGQLFVSTPVATGQPALRTPTGTYHFFAKYSPYTFISLWPVGSPYYYASVTANYAMEWAQGGYFLHDAPWRGYFGKGANYWHYDPKMGEDPGTHGCIDVPTPAMARIFSWATIGTTIQINP